MTKFKQGKKYYVGDSLSDTITIHRVLKDGVIYSLGNNSKKLYAHVNATVGAEHQMLRIKKNMYVFSWNISGLHELRKNDFLKKLATELHGN